MKWSVFKGTQIDSPRVAFALILTALFFLSLQDGLVKFASATSSKNPKAVIFRTAAIMGTMIFFFSGAPFLTLPEMGAGLYTYPIFMTVLSMIFLREKVGVWRLLAIILAATGAILIIRPSSQSFHAAQILPIFAGFFYSINAIILRKYCRDESPCAICNVTGNVLIVKAYQSAELSGLAPVDYSYLIFATFWGFAFFSGLPNMPTVFGMIFIAVAGILTAWRQRQDTAPLSFTNP